jgi:hypothetical protein
MSDDQPDPGHVTDTPGDDDDTPDEHVTDPYDPDYSDDDDD